MIQAFTTASQYVKTVVMGRKTKKEKVLAQYRRKIQQIETLSPVNTSPTYQLAEKKHFITPEKSPQYNLTGNHAYVVNDLRRIVILSVLAICAQVVLWYVLRK